VSQGGGQLASEGAAYRQARLLLVLGAEHLQQVLLVGQHTLRGQARREKCRRFPVCSLTRLGHVGVHRATLQHVIQVLLPARSVARELLAKQAPRAVARLVAPRDHRVAVAGNLEAQALGLVSHHRHVGQPLLACAPQSAVLEGHRLALRTHGLLQRHLVRAAGRAATDRET